MANETNIPSTPPSTGKSQSLAAKTAGKITLRTYVETLRLAATAEMPRLRDITEIDQRVIKELMDAGLLSDARTKLGLSTFTLPVVLTPSGAQALVEWSDYLRRESWWYKAGSAFVRFLWVIVGALCASLPNLWN